MRFDDFTIGVDFDDASDTAARYGLDLAAACDAKVSLLHAVRTQMFDGETIITVEDGPPRSFSQVMHERAQEMLHLLERRLGPLDRQRISLDTRWDDAAEGVVAQAQARDSDLIIVGSHGRTGFKRFFLGSVAEAVVRRAERPVLVARPGTLPKKIVVAIDLGPESVHILQTANAWAERFGASVQVVTAANPAPMGTVEGFMAVPYVADVQASAERALERLLAQAEVNPEHFKPSPRVELGWVPDAILQAADRFDAELVIVGSHGRRGLPRMFLGSVASTVIRHARLPVLVVRRPRSEAA